MRVPYLPDHLTPEWLNAALRGTSPADNGEVISLDVQQIGVGRGYAGLVLRVTARYDRPVAWPPSFVVKMPSPVLTRTDGVGQFTMHRTEAYWYRDLQPLTPVRTPVCYWQGVDEDNTRACILLEDLGHLRVTDQINSCRSQDARLAIRHLARLHAAFWRSEVLDQLDWLPRSEERVQSLVDLWSNGWQVFVDEFGQALPQGFGPIGERIGAAIVGLVLGGLMGGGTLVHGDYRLENFMFGEPGSADEFVVLDWQTIENGSAARDLAYFLSQNLTIGDRRRNEPTFLRLYHDDLVSLGVPDYPYGQFYQDYRRGLLLALHLPILGALTLRQLEDAGAPPMAPDDLHRYHQALGAARLLIRTMAERNAAAVIDNSAQELL